MCVCVCMCVRVCIYFLEIQAVFTLQAPAVLNYIPYL